FVLALAWLMVSTWRFYSFKEIDLGRRHPYVFMVALAALMAGIWFYSEMVLMGVVVVYIGSAVVWRSIYYLHRRRRAHAH
ncbi:MAG: CDP-diacylglycerol--serine O-phosphatidyltransferase, partial [Terriglobales bacterium]